MFRDRSWCSCTGGFFPVGHQRHLVCTKKMEAAAAKAAEEAKNKVLSKLAESTVYLTEPTVHFAELPLKSLKKQCPRADEYIRCRRREQRGPPSLAGREGHGRGRLCKPRPGYVGAVADAPGSEKGAARIVGATDRGGDRHRGCGGEADRETAKEAKSFCHGTAKVADWFKFPAGSGSRGLRKALQQLFANTGELRFLQWTLAAAPDNKREKPEKVLTRDQITAGVKFMQANMLRFNNGLRLTQWRLEQRYDPQSPTSGWRGADITEGARELQKERSKPRGEEHLPITLRNVAPWFLKKVVFPYIFTDFFASSVLFLGEPSIGKTPVIASRASWVPRPAPNRPIG